MYLIQYQLRVRSKQIIDFVVSDFDETFFMSALECQANRFLFGSCKAPPSAGLREPDNVFLTLSDSHMRPPGLEPQNLVHTKFEISNGCKHHNKQHHTLLHLMQ